MDMCDNYTRESLLVDNNPIVVTGSSGYVASDLIPRLKQSHEVFGVDLCSSENTDILANIGSQEFSEFIDNLFHEKAIVINLAAARFDFGATAADYYGLNVSCHERLLNSLKNLNIKKFIHVSSVASLEGKCIDYSDQLNCDDAYRSTKYLQEILVQKWCGDRGIELHILYPSAIFSSESRADTNIGKLQSVSKYIPFIPKIDAVKSLTYLPNFSRFIIDSIFNEIASGKYLTIEKPSLTVSKMIQVISGRSIKLVRIPFLSIILKILANSLYVLGFFGRIDLKLTPNRVVKLFSDTSYNNVNCEDIDKETYASRNCKQLSEILGNFNKEKMNG